MNRKQQHALIRARAESALLDLYHNATPRYPRLDDEEGEGEGERFQEWFEVSAQFEIEYLRDGGAYGRDYRKTLEAPCNAGKYQSPAARRYYVAMKMRECREDQERNAWERIGDYGKLYQWGRGGRTLAPDDLIKTGGGSSFSIRTDAADEMPTRGVIDLIRVVESFNSYVADWCKSVPERWAEVERERITEERATRRVERARQRAQKAIQLRGDTYAG